MTGQTWCKRNCCKEILFALAGALLPLFVQLIWLLHNTQLPTADADEQLASSYRIYQYFSHHQFFKFLGELYHARNYQWRPIGFYLFEFPFTIVSGGNLEFTAKAITLFCTLLSCIYIYRLFRLELETAPAVIGTAMLGLLPCVQWPDMFYGFSGDAFMPAILAAMYYFIRSENLRNRHDRIGFIIAVLIAFLVRPVETVNHLILVLSVFLWLAYKRGDVSGREIYRIVLGALLSASALLISGWAGHGLQSHSSIYKEVAEGKMFNKIIITCVALTVILWLAVNIRAVLAYTKASLQGFSEIEKLFYIIYASVIFFYLPYINNLFEWVYTCSFGSLAVLNQKPPLRYILAGFVKDTGLVPFTAILLTGTFSFLLCITQEQKQKLARHPYLYLLALIPPTLFMTLVSAQFLQRKVTVIITALLLACLIPALMRGRLLYLRLLSLAIIALFQFYSVLWIADARIPNEYIKLFAGGAYPAMVTLSPNPNNVMYKFIEAGAQKRGYKMIFLPVSTASVVDPFLLTMLVEIQNNNIHLGFPYIPSYDVGSVKEFLSKPQDAFILINDREAPITQSKEEAERLHKLAKDASVPNDKLMYDLQALYAEDKFKELGITKQECITIAGFSREACIFELKKK